VAEPAAQPVRVEHEGDVAIVVLDDPPLNLFRSETLDGLRDANAEIAASEARAAVFRAEGRVFTGGVDVNLFAQIADGDEGMRLAGQVLADLSSFERLEIPTLALVGGLCLTAGLEAALGCDMIWAADDARFGLVERVVGLTPFGGGVQRMAERAGPARAREFVMSGDLYDAATMREWGVVNRTLPADELLERGLEFAQRLAAGPTVAHGVTKRLVRAWLDGGVEEADRITAEEAGALFDTEDLKGAVRSFLSEGPGKARFEGR
jgi:enoyl-CoA hydratase/carnithine racemase